MAYVVEQVPSGLVLPPLLQQGSATACSWSDSHSRLRSSKHIAEAELLAPVSFALEAGSALSGQHVVFVMDNDTDVAIINRRKTSSKPLLFLLRRLALAAARFGFSFTAIHRPGSRNILPDVLSRPNEHGFSSEVPPSLDLIKSIVAGKTAHFGPAPSPIPAPISRSFGSFFFSDLISHIAASKPVLHPSSLRFCCSASLACAQISR